MVWTGAIGAVFLHAWVFFAGEYLPYIDWSNHLGLAALFGSGGPYVERSLLPTPYLLFYAFVAIVGSITGVVAAAKIALLTSTFLFTLGAALLCESTGRHPRLGLIAPLALFGLSLGWGFASFLFAMPLMLFVFAFNERALAAPSKKNIGLLALFILLTYLGHAMIFAVTMIAVGIRSIRRPKTLALACLPTIVVALPILIRTIVTPWREEGAAQPSGKLFTFAWPQQLNNLGGDLLDRGSDDHWTTMWWALALLGLWLAISVFRARREQRGWGLEIYASCLAATYLLGPTGIEWPFAVWLVHARFATLAVLMLFLLPRTDLSGKLGAALALLPLGLLFHNASINRRHITWFNETAKLYDPVRAAVPPGTRVLALSVVPAGDLIHRHHALGSLYFYHLADGAVHSAFLFDQAMQPIHLTKDRPRQPFWRDPNAFDAKTHGVDYDYLVLRGQGLVLRAKTSGRHDQVGEYNGWTVFKTREPTPFPEGWTAPPTR